MGLLHPILQLGTRSFYSRMIFVLVGHVIWMIAAGYVVSSLFMPAYATDLASVSEKVPLLETTQCQLIGTNNGRLKFTIKTDEICHYENGDVVLSGNIDIVIWELDNSNDGRVEDVTYVQGHTLTYNKQEKLCFIQGNVQVHKPSEALKIRTEQLFYNTEKENFFTEVPIEIEHKKNLLKGNGLWATKDLKQYTLKAPQGNMELEDSLVTDQ